MEFLVQERGQAIPRAESSRYILLRQDTWDDYTFKTTFTVELRDYAASAVIGTVKILKRGQEAGYTALPGTTFRALGDDYCSLGQSTSYYESLKSLGPDVYLPVLVALRDIVYEPSIRAEFLDEPGLELSLERNGSSVRAFQDAASLFERVPYMPAQTKSTLKLSFFSSVGGSDFTFPMRFGDSPHLPDRINAVIGYNGTGKTRLLANLGMVANADAAERANDAFALNYGRFLETNREAFGAVITVSYSAFDTFDVPGSNSKERERLRRVGNVFGHVYCGLRTFGSVKEDLKEPHKLKSISEIEKEFFATLSSASNVTRRGFFEEALMPIEAEPSFERLGVSLRNIHTDTFRKVIYPTLSTGHKIILNIVTQLAAHLQPRSLVLMDEPEVHLHPPLLAALIKSINILLERRDSFAVIATHSPVVLQEVPRQYVRVLRRFGNRTVVHEPEIETFGENVGSLTRHVFNLDSTSTDFHSVLKKLAEELPVSEIEGLFQRGMSSQARAYLVSLKREMERS
ncbi:AAA family ATPase [Micromonospora sp. NPDC093277]|uniref:AAA family ATPase n=1 Tax=Micromonospora sp. NPDC093277 TaxID=3364291 RepID=UPI0038242FAD